MAALLPPTSASLADPEARPYFVWWTDLDVRGFQARLRSPDLEERAYWMAALLREANTRDVWLFVSPADIRALWPRLQRYLGRARAMWGYLLGLDAEPWPPPRAKDA